MYCTFCTFNKLLCLHNVMHGGRASQAHLKSSINTSLRMRSTCPLDYRRIMSPAPSGVAMMPRLGDVTADGVY